jgi:hypothetical protein
LLPLTVGVTPLIVAVAIPVVFTSIAIPLLLSSSLQPVINDAAETNNIELATMLRNFLLIMFFPF